MLLDSWISGYPDIAKYFSGAGSPGNFQDPKTQRFEKSRFIIFIIIKIL